MYRTNRDNCKSNSWLSKEILILKLIEIKTPIQKRIGVAKTKKNPLKDTKNNDIGDEYSK